MSGTLRGYLQNMNNLTPVAAAATTLVAGLGLGAAAAPAQKGKPKPQPGQAAVTLVASPTPVLFGSAVTLSGRLTGAADGTVLRLEQDTTRPYGDAYERTGLTTRAADNGKYAFSTKPVSNVQHRVVAEASPPATSAAKLVLVRLRTGLSVSTRTPRAGSLVRFAGSVLPAHDGATVVVQRRSSTGSFVTVARTTLRDAGTARSSYAVRVRVRRDGAYRVKATGDADHVNGFSRTVTLDAR